jgi:predicted SAM-dependent methyltransferase
VTAKPKNHPLIDTWRTQAAGRGLVLHVCGVHTPQPALYERYRTPQWCEIRVTPKPPATLQSCFRDLRELPEGSIDAIWLSHALELLPASQVADALAACYRILKPEGEMGLVTPDLQAVAAHVAHGRLETPLTLAQNDTHMVPLQMLYGANSEYRTGFTAETLAEKFTTTGFSNSTVMCKELQLWVGAFKYPAGHSKRIDKTRIMREKNAATPPPAPPLSAATHPGLLHKGKLPDELDVPPKQWAN